MTVVDLDIVALQWVRRACRDGTARAIRTEAAITLAEMAAEIGVRGPTISRWENNERVPRGEAARRYAAALLALKEGARPIGGDDDSP